jgi:hypothetical protein
VNERASGGQRSVLLFSAVAEVATGLVLMLDPAILVRLLFGVELSGVAPALARSFGVALLALGLAPALRTLTVYNGLIALYLAYLGVSGASTGPLLWPVVAIHAVVALLLVWTGRQRRASVS